MRRDKQRYNNKALTRSSMIPFWSPIAIATSYFLRLELLCGEGFHCTYIAEGFCSVTVGYCKGVVYLSVEVI